MYFKILSGTYAGPRAVVITVEASADRGLPCFSLVGLPDAPSRESRERIRAAFHNSGFRFPQTRVTVNLLPPDLRKNGIAHEAALAAAVLGTQGFIDRERITGTMVLGGVDLGGNLLPVRGILGYLSEAAAAGVKRAVIPEANMEEAALIEGLEIVPARNLRDLVGILGSGEGSTCQDASSGLPVLTRETDTPDAISHFESFRWDEDFADVLGQENAIRAAVVAAAGGHNLLLLGPPGVGKTMIGRRVRTILPPLPLKGRVELMNLHGLAGILDEEDRRRILQGERPMRSPHTGVTVAGLIGGGHASLPGEAALAHRGVLFIDEICEVSRETLEALRGPMSDRQVTISRPYMKVTYPCDVMVVAAANLCPCGNRGDGRRECRCSPASVRRYFARLSGAFLDRIDIRCNLGRPAKSSESFEFRGCRERGDFAAPQTSGEIRAAVCAARTRGEERYGMEGVTNSNASPARFTSCLNPGRGTEAVLSGLAGSLGFDGRGKSRILRVARTIADLEGSESVEEEHLLEAASHVRDPRHGTCPEVFNRAHGFPAGKTWEIPWPSPSGTILAGAEAPFRRPFL